MNDILRRKKEAMMMARGSRSSKMKLLGSRLITLSLLRKVALK
jgi:hypothetical protein